MYLSNQRVDIKSLQYSNNQGNFFELVKIFAKHNAWDILSSHIATIENAEKKN